MVVGASGEGLAGTLPMSEFVTPREEEFTTPRDQAFHSARNEEAKEAYTTPRDEGDSYQTPRDEHYSEQKQADEAESKWSEYKDEEHINIFTAMPQQRTRGRFASCWMVCLGSLQGMMRMITE